MQTSERAGRKTDGRTDIYRDVNEIWFFFFSETIKVISFCSEIEINSRKNWYLYIRFLHMMRLIEVEWKKFESTIKTVLRCQQ